MSAVVGFPFTRPLVVVTLPPSPLFYLLPPPTHLLFWPHYFLFPLILPVLSLPSLKASSTPMIVSRPLWALQYFKHVYVKIQN